jgi:hypothetical protein
MTSLRLGGEDDRLLLQRSWLKGQKGRCEMKWPGVSEIRLVLIAFVAAVGAGAGSMNGATDSQAPVADAGSSRYAAEDPVQLDGAGSYDPDDSGTLSYAWRQVSGPSAVVSDGNTATPTISGFVQTSQIQECEFELVVSDGHR